MLVVIFELVDLAYQHIDLLAILCNLLQALALELLLLELVVAELLLQVLVLLLQLGIVALPRSQLIDFRRQLSNEIVLVTRYRRPGEPHDIGSQRLRLRRDEPRGELRVPLLLQSVATLGRSRPHEVLGGFGPGLKWLGVFFFSDSLGVRVIQLVLEVHWLGRVLVFWRFGL